MKFEYTPELDTAWITHYLNKVRRQKLNLIRDACEAVERGGKIHECPYKFKSKDWLIWRNIYWNYHDEYNSCRNYY